VRFVQDAPVVGVVEAPEEVNQLSTRSKRSSVRGSRRISPSTQSTATRHRVPPGEVEKQRRGVEPGHRCAGPRRAGCLCAAHQCCSPRRWRPGAAEVGIDAWSWLCCLPSCWARSALPSRSGGPARVASRLHADRTKDPRARRRALPYCWDRTRPPAAATTGPGAAREGSCRASRSGCERGRR
jgi:hypothetical protein